MKMRELFAAAAMAAPFALSAPVMAAPIEQIGCVEENMDAALVAKLTDTFLGGERPEISTSDSEDYKAIVDGCIAQFNWSETDAKNAGVYAVSNAMMTQSGERLRGIDVRLDVLDAYVAKNFNHWKSVGLKNGFDAEEFDAMADTAGIALDTFSYEQGRDVGIYMVAAFLRMRVMEAFVAGEIFDYRLALRS